MTEDFATEYKSSCDRNLFEYHPEYIYSRYDEEDGAEDDHENAEEEDEDQEDKATNEA